MVRMRRRRLPIVVLAAFVLAEKTLPNSRWLSRSGGLIFVAWGVAVLLAG